MRRGLTYNVGSLFPVKAKDYYWQLLFCPDGSPKTGLTLCVCTAYNPNDDGVDVQVVWISRRSGERAIK